MKLFLRIVLALSVILALACLPAAAESFTAPRVPEEHISVTGNIPDNDELLDSYIARMFSVGDLPTRVVLRGDGLTGNDAKLYQALRTCIAEVAAGERASTVFEVPLSSINKTTWTAAELGVDALLVDGGIPSAVWDAFWAQYDSNLRAVLDALLADCPYELYWYDKTQGVSMRGSPVSVSVDTVDGVETLSADGGSYTYIFFVAAGYQGSSETTVDASGAQTAAAAVASARQIVDELSGSGDYEKLVGYKNRICLLTDYNDEAAENTATPYGDPWQLVWVFDGDESTKVVCEGYSKAFKYLCDLSGFRGSVDCQLATGMMSGEGWGGAHMWNVVRMPDGKWYLADVTNCDAGTIGADDLLFLKGASAGSPAEGYTFVCYGSDILYAYDGGAGPELSTTDYDASAAQPAASGTWGTCAWELDNAGTMTIHAGNAGEVSEAPWKSTEPTAIVFETGVVLSGSCSGLFQESLVESIDLSGADTSDVTDMSFMFYCCSRLTTLDVSGFDTSSVTDMESMFADCSQLTTLDLSGFDTSSVTGMWGMFEGCSSLATITLGEHFSFMGAGSAVLCTLPDDFPWVSQTAGQVFTAQEIAENRNNLADTYRRAEPYTVSFDANGGEGEMQPQTLCLGAPQALTANAFTRAGCDFAGWNTAADGTGAAYADGAQVSGLAAEAGATVTLYAQWTPQDGVITLPADTTTIGVEAFRNIASGYVEIPGNVNSIAEDAFDAGVTLIVTPGTYADSWARDHGFRVMYR